MESSESAIVFLDGNDYEYIIDNVEGLFWELEVTDNILDEQLMDALKYMSIEEFLNEFAIEFTDIMKGYSRHYQEGFKKLITKI